MMKGGIPFLVTVVPVVLCSLQGVMFSKAYAPKGTSILESIQKR